MWWENIPPPSSQAVVFEGSTMLVLTRKTEEKITIGQGDAKVVVTILKIQGDKVSIGIEANKQTPIFRNELIHQPTLEVNI